VSAALAHGDQPVPRKGATETAKASRLKVFGAQFGFYDSIVAAPSQAAALRAWDTHQNLFAEGRARPITDEVLVEAACAQPNVPLRRAVGGTGAFEVEPTSLPVVPDLPKPTRQRHAPAKAKAAPRPKPPADRSGLDAAERAASALDKQRQAEEVAFAKRQSDLDDAIKQARDRYREQRAKLRAAVAAAREAYRAAGGTE
jgi:fermentation-respiration switch protein FrsA (DUF1100 family)